MSMPAALILTTVAGPSLRSEGDLMQLVTGEKP